MIIVDFPAECCHVPKLVIKRFGDLWLVWKSECHRAIFPIRPSRLMLFLLLTRAGCIVFSITLDTKLYSIQRRLFSCWKELVRFKCDSLTGGRFADSDIMPLAPLATLFQAILQLLSVAVVCISAFPLKCKF